VDPLLSKLVFDAGSEEDRRLTRYEELRGRRPLRVEITPTADRVAVRFEEPPPPLDHTDPLLAARAIAWLGALERDWGEPLGDALHHEELAFDPVRNLFAVGPGLLRPSGDRAPLERLAGVIGVGVGGVRSFGQLAAVAAREVPLLAPLLRAQSTPEETLRHLDALVDQAQATKAHDDALRFAVLAFEIRPTDPALAERVAAAWLKAGRKGPPTPSVLPLLESSAIDRPRAAVLLARFARADGRIEEARRWAEVAVAKAPDDREAWELLAKVANDVGDERRMLDALVEVARSGRAEVLEVVARRAPARAAEVLDQWGGPWTPSLVEHRIRQLHVEERLGELVRTFLEHLDAVRSEEVCAWVHAAVRRLQTAEALRQNLWYRVPAGASDVVIGLLVRLCHDAKAWAALIDLAARYPASVSRRILAEALLRERRFDEVLDLTDPTLSPERLDAMVQLGLGQPDRFPQQEWSGAVRACAATSDGAATLARLARQLREHAPGFVGLHAIETALTGGAT
jgi:hypothetical protein